MRSYLILIFKFLKPNSMKNSIYFVVICATLLFPCCKKSTEAASCLPANLNKGVIAFYPFSNGSLNDVLNNHNLSNTTTAKPINDRAGNANSAFVFKNASSANAFLHLKNAIFLDKISELSISLWYMPLDTNVYQSLVERVSNNNACNDGGGDWGLALHGGCLKVGFYMNKRGIIDRYLEKQCTSSDYIGKWQHVAITAKNNKLQLFINGIFMGSCETISNNGLCSGDLFIGRGFNGVIDDVLLYNRELTEVEVKQLQKLPACSE
jgi:hypothetical protein